MSSIDQIVAALPLYSYVIADEKKTQDGIATVFGLHGIWFEKECRDCGNRYDFLCSGGVVVEVKRDGSFSAAMRQAERYCQSRAVSGVVVATTRPWRPSGQCGVFNSKPVYVVQLPGPGL